MNDDGDTAATSAASAASAAPTAATAVDAVAAVDAAATATPTTARSEVKPEVKSQEVDPLFWSKLLSTHRLLEKEARAAKISSLSIV